MVTSHVVMVLAEGGWEVGKNSPRTVKNVCKCHKVASQDVPI